MEIWISIKKELYPEGGFKQTYSVSDLGKVKNNKTGRILKGRTDRSGYLRVNLSGKDFSIHRLVALHFIENENNELNQVNHIDGIKTNNQVLNLEWVNNSLNQKHAYKLGLQPSRKGENNPMFGKPCSEERKKKISEARIAGGKGNGRTKQKKTV